MSFIPNFFSKVIATLSKASDCSGTHHFTNSTTTMASKIYGESPDLMIVALPSLTHGQSYAQYAFGDHLKIGDILDLVKCVLTTIGLQKLMKTLHEFVVL
jgi:hypothetical protein